MQISQFIDKLIELINAVNKDDRNEIDVLVRVESKLAFEALLAKLEKFANQIGSSTANERNLKFLSNLLEDRWKAIRLTDANYCHAPDSLANKVYLIVATELARLTGKLPYDYLMPSVNAASYKTTKGTLHNLRLHEFVFGDSATRRSSNMMLATSTSRQIAMSELCALDVGEPIEVFKCLDDASTSPYRRLRTTCTDTPVDLNQGEEERVRKHSQKMQDFHLAIKSFLADTAVQKARAAALNALNNEAYIVSSSFDDEGKQRLIAVIISMCDNLQSLANMLATTIARNEWHLFLSQINKKLLQAIVLSDKSLNACVSNPSAYCQNETYNAAVLYCFAFAYRIAREEKNDYKSLAKGWLREYNKLEKLAATDVLLAFFVDNANLTLEEFHKTVPTPHGVTLDRRWAALCDGELGAIAKSTMERLNPKHIDGTRHAFLYLS